MIRSLTTAFALIITLGPQVVAAQQTEFNSLSERPQLAKDDASNGVIRGLQATGYAIDDVTTTPLGQTQITANNGINRREMVINPTTGDVLSDVAIGLPLDAQTAARQQALANASEPKIDDGRFGITFSGSVTLGLNSRSGAFGYASLYAEKENINGSSFSGAVGITSGFDR